MVDTRLTKAICYATRTGYGVGPRVRGIPPTLRDRSVGLLGRCPTVAAPGGNDMEVFS